MKSNRDWIVSTFVWRIDLRPGAEPELCQIVVVDSVPASFLGEIAAIVLPGLDDLQQGLDLGAGGRAFARPRTHGLGLAGTHVRLNASQLHNAIRKQIGMDTAPDDPTSRNRYLVAINALIDDIEPVTINFGSVMAERARRRSAGGSSIPMLRCLGTGIRRSG